MSVTDDPRLSDARARDIFDVADLLRIGGLSRPRGGKKVGPCPAPGCGGTDRFSLDQRKRLFNCRHCGGGDAIRLVEMVRGCSFREALDWLCGPQPELSEAERKVQAEAAEKNRKLQEAKAEKMRLAAVHRARLIWKQGLDAGDQVLLAYLARRGIDSLALGAPPACLRFHPALPYMIEGETRGDWIEIHRGPAMLAAIQKPNGRAEAVHRTWIDPAQPNGKALILHPDTGAVLVAKKVEGSKKGGAIRLTGPLRAPTLIMGEGIETTLSAMVGWDGEAAMFWAGVDLGNLAGARITGKGLKYAGIPDMSDAEAFVPPPWVTRLIFVMDGDSEPRLTEAKLQAGLRRAMVLVPGLKGQIARAPQGMDLNDVLMGGGSDDTSLD